jgi:3-oxoacyl-[acyl-carrier protein] reductase
VADRYQQLINTPIGQIVSKQVGLPNSVKLERYQPGQPVIDGPVLLGAAPASHHAGALESLLKGIGADVVPAGESFKALVFDATGIASSEELTEAWSFFHPRIRQVRNSGRVIVLGTPPEVCKTPPAAIAQRALEGLVRSIGKEVRHGATAQLLYLHPGASEIESTLRFFLSPKSAYVSGQVVRIGEPVAAVDKVDSEQPLNGKVALVTGASRGVGAAIAEVLARDGAHVVGVDLPAQADHLNAVTSGLSGSALTLDVTDAEAPAKIADHLLEHHEGVDVVVHNAGIIRDKTLGKMSRSLWDTVIGVNLTAPQRIDRELFGRKAVRENGRIIAVSSISGIAGNAGQTNYSTSKAGVIGIVQTWAPALAKLGVTINAVAPGFIETQMTAAMPIATREVGRRMNSLAQGGLPIDVAETIAWFANPGSAGVTGNIVRVCGQSLIGV